MDGKELLYVSGRSAFHGQVSNPVFSVTFIILWTRNPCNFTKSVFSSYRWHKYNFIVSYFKQNIYDELFHMISHSYPLEYIDSKTGCISSMVDQYYKCEQNQNLIVLSIPI